MKDLVFITSNQDKADYLAKWLGRPVPHRKLDLNEIQSLDLREIIEHKAHQAYDIVRQPVLVEDVALTFAAFKLLPGPFIKWFEEGCGLEAVCRMLDGFDSRSAVARTLYGLFDGEKLQLFEGVMRGRIAEHPRGDSGFGFDAIFINAGQPSTRAEMDEATYVATSYRKPALTGLRDYLPKLEKPV